MLKKLLVAAVAAGALAVVRKLSSGKASWPVGHSHDGGSTVKVPARDVLILRID